MKRLPVRVIPHHIRLSQADRDFLFDTAPVQAPAGSQWLPGRCTLATALHRIPDVQICATAVPHSYAIVTRSDAQLLQIDPPVRSHGDLVDTPQLTVIGPDGRHLTLPLIIQLRQIRLLPEDARGLQIRNGDYLLAAVQSDVSTARRSAGRDLIFSGIEAVIGTDAPSELLLDSDEANAAGVTSGALVRIMKTPPPASPPPDSYYPQKRLINERDVLDALQRRQKIKITPGMLITPAARELGRERDVFV